MRLVSRRMLLLAACLLLITSASFASVITFNNLPGNGTAIPNGYAGLNWNNFYDMNLLTPVNGGAYNGGVPAMSSYAFNKAGAVATFGSTGTFTFTSAWLGTEWANHLGLEVLGLLDGKIVDRTILVLNAGAPTLQSFNWSGIDEVKFSPLGTATSKGTLQFEMSSLVINTSTPEPASLLLLMSGLALGVTRLRNPRSAR